MVYDCLLIKFVMRIGLFLNLHTLIITFQACEGLGIFVGLIGLFGNELNKFQDIHKFILMDEIDNMQTIRQSNSLQTTHSFNLHCHLINSYIIIISYFSSDRELSY